MPNALTDAQVARYHADGFSDAIDVLTPDETRHARAALEAWERRLGHTLDFPEKSKSYLLFDWADRIVHHPRVLDAVEDVLGPDILVYHTTMWIKEARSPAYVLWHQDGAYFHLDPPLHVTAWVALSDASRAAGCMRFIPGSQRLGWLPHVDRPGPNNMIRRGQGVDGYDDREGVAVPLRAGQMSLHHTAVLHASAGNDTDDRRMGFGISYIPPSVRCTISTSVRCTTPTSVRCTTTGPRPPSALLVRGEDRFGHFAAETRLAAEMSEAARAAHADANARFRALQDAGFKAA